ncbi:putative adenosyl cobinamide kinase/ cobinamide phosphate guanylyltransferase [Oceaniovalibus guishaninsula JLT2003]|uniref:Adenosylcobinamide kinase n=2 Tax=Oceaniovalibus TaxID=1207070 RepID=K2HLU6_9RHOB|nr:putative adenosyl cobinamide kinase/ cobinamide phosphate guanylyltransferase [Oceaniovalibus guishaninsula JLT2003]
MAERIARATRLPLTYIATAQPFDDEMTAKIALHRKGRAADGWQTVEVPLELGRSIAALPAGGAALVDCATLWLTNVLLAGRDTDGAIIDLLAAIAARPCPLIVVSNEVGLGIVPDNALSRRFREAQGRLNRALAAEADRVVGVMAGLPLALKGTLPEGAS